MVLVGKHCKARSDNNDGQTPKRGQPTQKSKDMKTAQGALGLEKNIWVSRRVEIASTLLSIYLEERTAQN
jgi:hypothetical protein